MKKLLSLLTTVLLAGSMWGDPVVLFHETFGNYSSSARDWSNTYSVKSGVEAVYANVEYTVTNAKQSKNTMGYGTSTEKGNTAGSALVSNQGGVGTIIMGPFNVSSYESLSLTHWFGKSSGASDTWNESRASNPDIMRVSYSTDYDSWTALTRSGSNPNSGAVGNTATNHNYVQATYTLPAATQVSTLYLKIEFYCYKTDKNSNQIGMVYIDEVELKGTLQEGQTTPGTITPDPTSISVTAAGEANGSIDVSYTYITDMTNVADVALYNDAQHTSAFAGSWLVAMWSDNTKTSIEYVVDANTGDARTAYIYLYAIDDNLNGIEKVIEVTQGKGDGAAILPFAFDGGKNDIANKAGLTQSGLGDDYNSSPKLKFDHANDYLILRVNEAIASLTFTIKGNPGQDEDNVAGTFKVQTSVDGETYTDLDTYVDLGKDALNKEYTTIAAEVRYIKWIYSAKTKGNFALGNIAAAKSGTTAVETVETSVKAVKVLRNGVLYIEKAGKTYNAQGQLVK